MKIKKPLYTILLASISLTLFIFSGCATSMSIKEQVDSDSQGKDSEIKSSSKPALKEGTNWLTYNFDNQRKGISKSNLTFPLKLSWKRKINGKLMKRVSSKKAHYSSPVVVGNLVFIGGNGKFMALDSNKNLILWETPVDGAVESSPTFYDENVFFGTDKGVFYSLNAQDGAINWTYQVTSPILSSPLVEKGMAFFNTLDSKVYALDIHSGNKIWQYLRKTPQKLKRAFTSPSFLNGKLYVGFSDGSLVGLDINDGTKIIDVQISDKKTAFLAPLQPVIVDGLIYIVTPETNLMVLDEYGKKLWSFDATKVSNFIVTKNKVFLLNLEGDVFAINKITGENIWRVKVTKGTPTHVIISGNDLIVSTKFITTFLDLAMLSNKGGFVEAFNTKTGAKKWSFKADAGISTSPVVVNDKLFFVSDKGYLHMFEPS